MCQALGTISHDDVMTWNAFRITDPLWWESTGDRWIPLTKDQWYYQHINSTVHIYIQQAVFIGFRLYKTTIKYISWLQQENPSPFQTTLFNALLIKRLSAWNIEYVILCYVFKMRNCPYIRLSLSNNLHNILLTSDSLEYQICYFFYHVSIMHNCPFVIFSYFC